ncbi:hypothetical protein BGZ82_001551 [Podila clonocystis]|nr:hypothetical protein BGZ82_001551 [Podila clonocystis]
MAIKKLCLEGFDFGLEPVAMPSSHPHLKISAFNRPLDRFALSLTTLDLNKCFRVSSKHTQKILTLCANLEYCVLPGLHVSDIFGLPRTGLPDQQGSAEDALTQTHSEGKDWVALKLKGLSVYIRGLKDADPALLDSLTCKNSMSATVAVCVSTRSTISGGGRTDSTAACARAYVSSRP